MGNTQSSPSTPPTTAPSLPSNLPSSSPPSPPPQPVASLNTSATNPSPSVALPAAPQPLDNSKRTRRQAGLFFGGVAFVVWSAFLTRRSLTRRRDRIISPAAATTLKQWQAVGRGQAAAPTLAPADATTSAISTANTVAPVAGKAGEVPGATKTPEQEKAEQEQMEQELKGSGPLVAVEALSIATINVLSWAVMVTGGLLWYFDIAGMDDLKRKVRSGMGVEDVSRSEQDAEEEVEEWIARVLERRERKEAVKRSKGQAVAAVDEIERER